MIIKNLTKMKINKEVQKRKKDMALSYIESIKTRNVTYCKRKRGFIKKAIELSVLCGQQISVLMYDNRKNKMVSYNTTGFDHQYARNLYQTHLDTKNKKLEAYTE